MTVDAFDRWQASGYTAHDTVCGTAHDGHCPLDCECWCHYGPEMAPAAVDRKATA